MSEGIVSKEKFLKEDVKGNINSEVWNKVFKRDLYDGLWFDEKVRYAEEYEILTELMLRVHRIIYISYPLYNYVVGRDGSLCRNATFKDMQRFYDLVLDRYQKTCGNIKIRRHSLVKVALSVLIRAYMEGVDAELSVYDGVVRENIKSIIFSGDFNLQEKSFISILWYGETLLRNEVQKLIKVYNV